MARCPVCSVEIDLAVVVTAPFCSERCRVIDLGRWLDESYAVPEIRRGGDDEEDGEGPQPGVPMAGDDDE